jgi:hypothetical protein
LFSFLVIVSKPVAAADPFDHTVFDRVLRAYVNESGQVNYTALKANRSELDAYVDALGKISPPSHPGSFSGREEKLAYWINAYNALVLRGVIDAYPVKSVKDIKYFSGFFNRTWFNVGGESYTLNNIEHDILRAEFDEPRIHAAINCASVGCPRLEASAFFAEGIEAKLDAVIARFLNESRNVTIDATNKTVTLSKILGWFGSDFIGWYNTKFGVADAGVLDYVALYIKEGFETTWEVRYHSYDWSLNDQERYGNCKP